MVEKFHGFQFLVSPTFNESFLVRIGRPVIKDGVSFIYDEAKFRTTGSNDSGLILFLLSSSFREKKYILCVDKF